MNLLGKIVRLQIQRSSLKLVENGLKFYDPAPLLTVEELTLTKTGASARAADGGFVIDVHNSAHPYTKNGGPNTLSVLFTSHYREMKARFGEHLVTGCAGENILVETRGVITLDQVAGGIVIEAKGGRVALGEVVVAAPCTSFSGFAIGSRNPATPELKEALQFLNCGMRGFYCALASESPATLELGAEVYAVYAV
jgi:hypothetical protein